MSIKLVTGGAGFIGSHIVKGLLAEGYEVRVLDNIARNVNHVAGLDIEFIKGDIRDKQTVIEAMRGCDTVFNQAAICLNRCKAHPQEAIDINLQGSYNVFGAAIRHGAKVVHASTSSVYGQPEYLPMDESHPANTIEPYGASKLCADKFLGFLSQKHGLKYAALRYFNVYGTYQSTDAYYTSVINVFIKNILHGKPPVINGDGSQSMDFTHISDVVSANIAAMHHGEGIYNVGYGKQWTLKDLAYVILKEMGSSLEPIFSPREVMVTKRLCDNTRLRELGVIPATDIQEGIKELVAHVKLQPEIY